MLEMKEPKETNVTLPKTPTLEMGFQAINEAMEALLYFYETGSRAKFREWSEKWGDYE